MRMPAAQTLTICSGVAFRPRVKAPRSALPSMLTTPLMAKPLLNLRRTVSRPFGSSARRTLLNVSWLGIPCLSSRNRRNNSNRPWPKNSNSVQLLAPASVAASAMITMSSRSCRVLSARGSLSGRSRRLSLRIQVSLNRETPQNPVPTALQHLSSAICDSPTLAGERVGVRGFLREYDRRWTCPPSPGSHPRCDPTSPRKRGEVENLSRLDLHVFKIAGLVVDADFRRRDPVGVDAGFGDRLHQRCDEVAVLGRGQPFALAGIPGGVIDQDALWRGVDIPELADLAVERDVRQRQLVLIAGGRNDLVPAQQALDAILRVVVAQPHVERGQRRLVDELDHRIGGILELVVVVDLGFLVAALDAGVEGIRRVGRDFRTKEIKRQRIMQMQLLLDGRQVDHPERTDFCDIGGI